MEAVLTTFDLSPRTKPQDLLELLAKNKSNEEAFQVMDLLIIHGKFV